MRPGFKAASKAGQMRVGIGPRGPARRLKKKPPRISGGPKGSQLLTTPEAAVYISVSPHTLKFWRRRKHRCGPRYLKLHAHAVRYRACDLEVFLESRLVKPARSSAEVDD